MHNLATLHNSVPFLTFNITVYHTTSKDTSEAVCNNNNAIISNGVTIIRTQNIQTTHTYIRTTIHYTHTHCQEHIYCKTWRYSKDFDGQLLNSSFMISMKVHSHNTTGHVNGRSPYIWIGDLWDGETTLWDYHTALALTSKKCKVAEYFQAFPLTIRHIGSWERREVGLYWSTHWGVLHTEVEYCRSVCCEFSYLAPHTTSQQSVIQTEKEMVSSSYWRWVRIMTIKWLQ